jgi:hypothetical protein
MHRQLFLSFCANKLLRTLNATCCIIKEFLQPIHQLLLQQSEFKCATRLLASIFFRGREPKPFHHIVFDELLTPEDAPTPPVFPRIHLRPEEAINVAKSAICKRL